MSLYDLQKPLLYLVAAGCLVGGIAMMRSGPEGPLDGGPGGGSGLPGNAPQIPAHTMHGPSGTVIGTGGYDQSKPQIQFENAPKAKPAETPDPFAFAAPETEEQRRRRERLEELRPVLERLAGEPVYVEGLDNKANRSR